MKATDFNIGDRFLNKSNKEVVMVTGYGKNNRLKLQDDEGNEIEVSMLGIQASYKHLNWQDGDIIESDNLIAEFKCFSSYSVAMAVCHWVSNKRDRLDIEGFDEVQICYFKKVKENAKLEVGTDGLKEIPKENKSEHQKLTDLANRIELWELDENGDVIDKHVLMDKEQEKYDYINPNHYKQGSKEVIEMMQDIWGKENLIAYCEMNAFKYRMRAGLKPEQSVERDLEKAKWYSDKANRLRNGCE